MMEIICAGMVLAIAAYFLSPRIPRRVSRAELPRYQRLSEQTRQKENYPFD